MRVYVIRRLVAIFPVLLVVGIVSFGLIHITPGDPAANILGDDATVEDLRIMRERLGLDRPIAAQFSSWFTRALIGDLGTSLYTSRPVLTMILDRIQPTVLLTFLSMIVALSVGIPAGMLGALFRNSPLDQVLLVVTLLGVSMPNFWLGLNLILLFGVTWQVLPVAGYVAIETNWTATLRHLILPALALGLSQAAIIARITRTSMLEVLSLDYIRTARAKGLRKRVVVLRHAFRNALISILTIVGVVMTVLLSGSVVVETVFSLPGIGRVTIEAVQRRDYPMIQGVILFVATFNVLFNLVIDLLYVSIDPRIQYS